MLIITGCGHSGTLFVATLFHIPHEPPKRGLQVNDYSAYLKAWQDKGFARQWVKENIMGIEMESNSFLVPFAEAILEEFPNCNIFHLVRDPKKVIRSLLSNGLYIDQADYHNIKLFDKSPNGEKWEALTPFQKTCWYWRVINEKLRKLGCPLIKLEELRGQPLHQKIHRVPPYQEWLKEQKDYFNKVVYPEARFYGYEKIKT